MLSGEGDQIPHVVINIEEWLAEPEDLLEDEERAKINTVSKLPIINICVHNLQVRCLIDSGANISVVSAGFLDMLEGKVKIPTIPIAGIKIKGIFPDKVQTCKKQVMLDIQIGELRTSYIFLVLARIKFAMILGVDFLREFEGIIDMKANTITLRLEGDMECIELNPQEDEIELAREVWNTITERSSEEVERTFDLIEHKIEEIDANEDVKFEIKGIIMKFADVFDTRPGKIANFQYKMRVRDWEPYQRKPYMVAEKYRHQVAKVIEDMCQADIISMKTSPFSNSLVVVQKPDGTVRVCLDARDLNDKLVPEYDSVPPVKEIIRKFQGMKYFTAIDLTSSYHHVELEERSRLLTGFWFDQRTYVFNRLPFGIKNAGSALIRALDRNLDPEVKKKIIKYIDDIIIATPDLESHLEILEKLLENLNRANFKINLKKSKFVGKEILFVGHIIDNGGIRTNPVKIHAIENFPIPRTIKQIRQFLGMCQFFADHCKNYTDTVAPLQDMLKKQNKRKWGQDQDEAFQATKKMMAEGVKLGYPDYEKPFIVQTDASCVGVGGVLYQEKEGDTSTSIYLAFASRRLRKHEVLYSVTELEMLAVVFSLKQWRKIIFGFDVVLRTDHRALTFMMKTCIASERVRRWGLYVQQFKIQIEHCPGKDNVLPDIFSRNPVKDQPSIHAIELVQEDRDILEELRGIAQAQKDEEALFQIIQYLKGEFIPGEQLAAKFRKQAEEYHLVNDILHKFTDDEHSKLRIVVPQKFHKAITYHAHRITGHGGIDKVQRTLGETFTWGKMRAVIRKYITACDVCQRVKASSHILKHEPIPLLPQHPRDLYAADLYGPVTRGMRGNRYILVTIDVFSKFTTLYPIQRATTNHVLRRLRNNIIPTMGKPRYLLTDHGPNFTSHEFQEGLEELEIRHVLSSIRHPEGNPAERVMRQLAKQCRIYCANQHWKWVQVLPEIARQMNTTFHESTQEVPEVVHWNTYPERPWHRIINSPPDLRPSNDIMVERVRAELKRRAEKRARRWKGKRFQRKLVVGELVLIRKPAVSNPQARRYSKFENLYFGPGRITRALANNAYEVEDLDGQNVAIYNAANLKLYHLVPED